MLTRLIPEKEQEADLEKLEKKIASAEFYYLSGHQDDDSSRLAGVQYSAAKTRLPGLMRHLVRDLGPSGIAVNAVAPGIIFSDRVRKLYELATTPLGARLQPSPVASKPRKWREEIG